MNIKVYTPIELEQQSSIMPYMFKEFVAPTLGNDIAKLLSFSMMINEWSTGMSIASGEYVRYGVDGKGFPMIYKANTSHVAQINTTPGSDNASNLYTVQGYFQGTRVWSQPFGVSSAYDLGEVVAHLGTSTHTAITYTKGSTVYKDDYIISPDNLVYQVIPNQIVMNTDAVPFTNTSVYKAIPTATVVNSTSIQLEEYLWWISLKADNRFEPVEGSSVWSLHVEEEEETNK